MKKNYLSKELNYPCKKISRDFSSLEWANLPFIDPLFFIDAFFQKGEHFGFNEEEMKIYSFNNLQNIFNKILARYFQSFKKNYLKQFIKEQLYFYCLFRNIILENQYAANPKIIFDDKNPGQLIIDLYRDLKKIRGGLKPKLVEKKIIIKNRFQYNEVKNLSRKYATVNFLKENLEKKSGKYISHFLIHGSFATRDFLENWSDLDTLIILNDAAFENANNLNSLQKELKKTALLLYKIDPLCHHLFMFLTCFDLGYYPYFLFPPVLYDYSALAFGESSLKINIRNDQYERIEIMGKFADYFRNKTLKQNYSANLIDWKEDIARLTLWPCLMLEAGNIYVYKKYSFERAKKEFPQINFEVVNQATRIMKNWKTCQLLRYYPDVFFNILPPNLNRIILNLCKKYFSKLRGEENKEEIKRITEQGLFLFENSLNLILKDLNHESRI